MNKCRRVLAVVTAGIVGIAGAGFAASAGAGPPDRLTNVEGTIWVANRGAHTIRGFDAATGEVVRTVEMRPGSQPGDLAFARGKLYVAEEFGTPPAIAIVDAETGIVTSRIELAAGSRPHHVHTTQSGRLVAFGLYGTDTVAVVDTRTDTLLGPWDTNPATTNGRVHAGVFSPNGRILYVASDASNEIIALDPRTGDIFWRVTVPGAHELVVTRNGKTAYVSRRTANRVCVLDLRTHTACNDVLTLGLPDTLRLSASGKLLTVTLRTMPAEMAVIDTRTFEYELVRLGPILEANTLAAHQWTSANGRYTFAAYEGGTAPGVAVIDHRAGNQIVATLAYAGRPHGVDLAPGDGDDDEEEDEEEDDDDDDEEDDD
jgi:DNA-binding beta-propeller fold protein YncE